MQHRETIEGVNYKIITEIDYEEHNDVLINWLKIIEGYSNTVKFTHDEVMSEAGSQCRQNVLDISEQLIENDVFTSISGRLPFDTIVNCILGSKPISYDIIFNNINKVLNEYKKQGNVLNSVTIIAPSNNSSFYISMFKHFCISLSGLRVTIVVSEKNNYFNEVKNLMFFNRDKKSFSKKIDAILFKLGSISFKRKK